MNEEEESQARDEHETAYSLAGDALILYIYEDKAEDYQNCGVSWRGLCGHFSVRLKCKSEADARKLFEALQLVSGTDES